MNIIATYYAGEHIPPNRNKIIQRVVDDTLGKRIGRLVAKEFLYTTIQLRNNGQYRYRHYFKFKCDCGNDFVNHIENVYYNNNKNYEASCGCANEERLEKNRQEYLKKIINENVGKRFGKLTVLEFESSESHRTKGNKVVIQYYFKCKCDCGNIVNHVNFSNLRCGHTRSCGCSLKYVDDNIKDPTDIVGLKFGKLTVIEYLGNEIAPYGDNITWYNYKAKCDCGNIVNTRRDILLTGSLLSCGCDRNYKEYINTRIYDIYRGILARCLVETSQSYHLYGGRGILLCDKWAESFENFFNDNFDKYVESVIENGAYNTSIDRIDTDGNYEPDNCRWATDEEQINNKRKTKYMDIFGERIPVAQAAKIYNINYNTLQGRLTNGISPIIAVNAPPRDLDTYIEKIKCPIEFFDPSNPPESYLQAKKDIL